MNSVCTQQRHDLDRYKNIVYLRIRLRARDFYEVIVEGEAQINYFYIEIESDCFATRYMYRGIDSE